MMFIYTITTALSLVGVIYLLRRGEMSPNAAGILITMTLVLFFIVLASAWKAVQ